jgi:hypothetical protein
LRSCETCKYLEKIIEAGHRGSSAAKYCLKLFPLSIAEADRISYLGHEELEEMKHESILMCA